MPCRFEDHPTALVTPAHSLVAIDRNRWSRSIGIGGRNQSEQVVAISRNAHRLAHVENINQQDSAERAFNKLARTYVAQVEALKRYRSAGDQTVRVEHVTVNEGGQAIVGNVTTGGRGSPQKPEATP